MRLLVDINVVLDVVLNRQPWAGDAALLFTRIESGEVEAFVAGHTVTAMYYVVAKAKDRHTAVTAVTDLLRLVSVVPVEKVDFHQALVLGIADFEDAVQVAAGLKVGVDYLVTRDQRDFKGTSLEVRSPGEVLALL